MDLFCFVLFFLYLFILPKAFASLIRCSKVQINLKIYFEKNEEIEEFERLHYVNRMVNKDKILVLDTDVKIGEIKWYCYLKSLGEVWLWSILLSHIGKCLLLSGLVREQN